MEEKEKMREGWGSPKAQDQVVTNVEFLFREAKLYIFKGSFDKKV